MSGGSPTPTPPGDLAAQHDLEDDDYDTDATESELAMSEPAVSPSPPVHDELTELRAAAAAGK